MKISAPLLTVALSASSFLGVDARMHRQHSHRDLAQRYKGDNVANAARMRRSLHARKTPGWGDSTEQPANMAAGTYTKDQGCAIWHTAGEGEICLGLIENSSKDFDLAKFMEFNPSVGNNCQNLTVGQGYCVDTVATDSAPANKSGSSPAVKVAAQVNGDQGRQDNGAEQKKQEAPKQEAAQFQEEKADAPAAPAEAAPAWQEAAAVEDNAPVLKMAKIETEDKPEKNNAPAPSAEGFKLTHDLRGGELLNFFNFEQKQGDNAGFANWVQDGSLQYVNDKGNVVFATDSTPVVDSRKTTRAVSKDTFSKGLFISRITHMPSTYGSWPSFWMVSNKAWPEGGEIDILEGVGSFSQNAASVHTTAGCSMPVSALEQTTSKFMLSGPQQTNCDTHATDSQGCGLRDDTPNTFGPGFNNVGGAYVAVHITDEFVKVHQWPGESAPQDVRNNAPAPSTWDKPALYLPNDQCNIGSHFYDLQLVFSTNVCGKWPGELWNLDASYAGQAQSSAQATGVDSCYEYAHSHGSEWGNAFFEVASISIFQ